MCEGEDGGGTIVCQCNFHFLAETQCKLCSSIQALMDPWVLQYALRPSPGALLFL